MANESGWEVEFTVHAPMRLANNGRWNPAFGVISKNRKIIVKGRFAVWSKEAKDWGSDLQFLSRQALHGLPVGDADYKITLQMRVHDKRRRDTHNFLEFICDALQSILEVDDSRFITETLPHKYVKNIEDSGFRVTIERL